MGLIKGNLPKNYHGNLSAFFRHTSLNFLERKQLFLRKFALYNLPAGR